MAEETEAGGFTRLSFIKASAGVAAGAAAVGVPAAVVMGGEPARVGAAPEVAAPREPVMAYVHDAARGEVTVMSGTSQTTYRDPVLVKRLLAAAPRITNVTGGGIDVIAP